MTWRPEFRGWAEDILPLYGLLAEEIPVNGIVVEVGNAWGRSLTYLASQLLLRGKSSVQLWGVDPYPTSWKYNWYHEAMSEWVRFATPGEMSMIRQVRADSKMASRMFQDDSIDLVFIDGMHDEPHVREDIQLWAAKVRHGGVISGHDYGAPEHPDVKRVVDDEFGVENVLVQATVWQTRPLAK